MKTKRTTGAMKAKTKPGRKRATKAEAKAPAASVTAKRGRGRPHIAVNVKMLRALAEIQCTLAEMAAVLGVSVDTLTRNYAEIIKSGQESGKSSLRRSMFKAAQGGNVTAQIWLSKQHLGMKDKTEFSGDRAEPIRITIEQQTPAGRVKKNADDSGHMDTR